jgi:hypothetical protein
MVRVVYACLILIGLISVDHLPSLWRDISPPSNIANLDDFREWRKDQVVAEGIFKTERETYTVVLGDSAAFFASGPAAYVFDSSGSFVDWTRDMGDISTEKLGFDLTGDHVTFQKTSKPTPYASP